MTHICVGKLTIIGSDNGLSSGWHQAIIWTNARILLIEPLGTNFSEILIGIKIVSFKKMRLKKLEIEDVVKAAQTGNALTTSELSTILLPTYVWLKLEA